MSYALFLFISLFFDFAYYSDFYCIFVPELYRRLKVDNMTLIKMLVLRMRNISKK